MRVKMMKKRRDEAEMMKRGRDEGEDDEEEEG